MCGKGPQSTATVRIAPSAHTAHTPTVISQMSRFFFMLIEKSLRQSMATEHFVSARMMKNMTSAAMTICKREKNQFTVRASLSKTCLADGLCILRINSIKRLSKPTRGCDEDNDVFYNTQQLRQPVSSRTVE